MTIKESAKDTCIGAGEYLIIISKNASSTSNLPPGPWKLPLIGNLHQLAAASSLPHRGLRELARKYGPLMHLQIGEVSTVVVSSMETAKEVMKTHDINFASRPRLNSVKLASYDFTDIVMAPYGEYWRQLRKIATLELLSSKRVKSFQHIRDEETSNLMRWIASNEGKPINLTHRVYSVIYTIISRMAFGKRNKDQETFEVAMDELLKLSSGFSITDIYPSIKLFHFMTRVNSKLEKLFQQTDRIVGNIINEHRANTSVEKHEYCKDLVDVLLKYHENADLEIHLTGDNVKAVVMDIFTAGGETSATTINWAMSEMLKNPSTLKKAQNEVRQAFRNKGCVEEEDMDKLEYLKAVVKETLRLHPPAPLLAPRQNSQRCKIFGYEIPAETRVIVNAWSIQRDAKYWKDGESFKPERFLDTQIDYKGAQFEYIPFGAGRRICPGMTLGLVNTEVALAKLLFHFNWVLPSGMKHEELDMTEEFGITAKRKADLYLIPILANSI